MSQIQNICQKWVLGLGAKAYSKGGGLLYVSKARKGAGLGVIDPTQGPLPSLSQGEIFLSMNSAPEGITVIKIVQLSRAGKLKNIVQFFAKKTTELFFPISIRNGIKCPHVGQKNFPN